MTARIVYQETEVAPAAMDAAVRRGASGLERLGVGQGDVVCIMLHNSPAFVVANLEPKVSVAVEGKRL